MNTQQLSGFDLISGTGTTGSEWDILFEPLFGVISLIIGWLIVKKIKNPQTKKEINFSACLSMCISGTLIIFKEIAEFFIDFYTGSNLLKADFVGDDHWLFRLVGFGKSPYEQRPLLDTDEDMILSVLGAVLSTGVLYLYLRKKNKALYIRKEYKRRSLKLKKIIAEKLAGEKEKLIRDCTIADYILWWGTRALMIYAFLVMEVRAEANLLLANLVATFTVTLIHLIFPSGTFLSEISYRVQSLLTVMVFLGSYCGNYVMIYNIVPRYDLFLHFVSGALCVFGGYYIALTLIKADSGKNIFLICLFSMCFSCFIMPAWEISEFIGDFIWGTSNQGFYWGPTDDSFLFRLFGRGAGNTALYPLYDTFYDVLLAVSTTIPSAAALFVYLTARHKKASEPGVEKQEKKILTVG